LVVANLAPNANLLGTSKEDAARVEQWVHLFETEVDTYTDLVRGITSSTIPYSKPVR